MTDLFQSWKDNRFIIVPDVLVDNEKLIILTDIQYWSCHADKLHEWCQGRNANVEGMTVMFGDEKTLVEFVLTWA